jgi:hypothetical protein
MLVVDWRRSALSAGPQRVAETSGELDVAASEMSGPGARRAIGKSRAASALNVRYDPEDVSYVGTAVAAVETAQRAGVSKLGRELRERESGCIAARAATIARASGSRAHAVMMSEPGRARPPRGRAKTPLSGCSHR